MHSEKLRYKKLFPYKDLIPVCKRSGNVSSLIKWEMITIPIL